MSGIPSFHGFGLGLRRPHYSAFMAGDVPVDFIEIISENYMVDGGRPLAVLDAVRERYPVAMHGVSLSVGSAQGVDWDYLARLKALAERIEPLWMSDHLCWTRTSAHNSHDLLPLPYTAEALDVVCANLARAQDALGRELLLENPSSYCSFPDDEMAEWEFLSEVCRRTGCHLLLDVNNVYVSARNHGFAADDFLAGIPMERVRQIHLAGHTPGAILIDTHDREVCDDVWALYAEAIAMTGPVATMIERDDAIPPLPVLLAELDVARDIAAQTERRAA
ncbi:DUF692 domain-containing protein [Sphingobium phenoxybenzoativorans]|jgi:uncharacterized protein (UPF0276 family)|uniref:UPF0276 protein EQG66_00845 n=2 Tax=Sphingobium TaxID=165695 RepID=A0A4Q1KLN4_9SPHN|nr:MULTISPECIES: DUF692 domain-containing protein [Sphingobium]QUT07598.1 DUF692 domain-containing protein [Sphingobium phenoxybenzoativorans]RXR30871.1 DUF692 domain-containing protein [Sphingobium fluviale]